MPPAGAIPAGGAVIFRSIFLKTLFFVYSGAISAPLVFRSDPNRDPNAEKSGGFIRTGKDTAVKFPERKGVEMP